MDNTTIWISIIALGIGTFLIRFSFLGMLGGKDCQIGSPATCVLYLWPYCPVWSRRWWYGPKLQVAKQTLPPAGQYC